MQSLLTFFNGKKTYIGIFLKAIAATGISALPQHAGIFNSLDNVGDFLIGVGVAHKMAKIEEKV